MSPNSDKKLKIAMASYLGECCVCGQSIKGQLPNHRIEYYEETVKNERRLSHVVCPSESLGGEQSQGQHLQATWVVDRSRRGSGKKSRKRAN